MDKPEIGKAYRLDADGIVRWVTDRSRAGYYQLRWQDEAGRWLNGGKVKAKDWATWGNWTEVLAPQPGDTVTIVGPLGLASSITLPAAGQGGGE